MSNTLRIDQLQHELFNAYRAMAQKERDAELKQASENLVRLQNELTELRTTLKNLLLDYEDLVVDFKMWVPHRTTQPLTDKQSVCAARKLLQSK